MHDIVKRRPLAKLPINISKAETAIFSAKRPEALRPLEAKLEQAENLMRESGLYTNDQLRKINEVRMWAFWKLGKLLKVIERAQGLKGIKKTDLTSGGARPTFSAFLTALNPPLAATSAKERQRVGAMPDAAMQKAVTAAHKADEPLTISGLLRHARPWWQLDNRERKHLDIAAKAGQQQPPGKIGPFPLIYADPPWPFDTYNWTGKGSAPDMHYPTLDLGKIKSFKVGKQSVLELAAKDAALLLWCTSSNIEQALQVMEAWGFTFRASAAWDKMKSGLGLVFINWHEILLYGTRGKMPGPLYKPPSLFHIPRTEHSVKPPEIRAEIEKMYPHFKNEKTRLELFARGTTEGWTCRGYEADSAQ
jgi:N6-adenosine-specific RNA methylase IME4